MANSSRQSLKNQKVQLDFTLPGFSATKIVMWNYHMNWSTKIRFDMILGRYMITSLVLDLKLSDSVIKGVGGLFDNNIAPMVNLGTYESKNLDTGKITPKGYFINAYVEELFESETFSLSLNYYL